MLQNGTNINGVMIEKPHRFLTAMTIATQIITCVASSQYGGTTISLAHLAPFVRQSKEYYYKRYEKRGLTPEQVSKFASEDLSKEITDGVQTFQYQINSMTTTNGQAPFLSVCMYLGETEEYKEELAMLIEETLKQRIVGMKNEKGVFITPAFPKLLYVLEEDNIHKDSKYYYLTELACKCTAKRMVPDYISEKIMKELKIDKNGNGNCYPCMGCRSFLTPYVDQNGKPKYYGRFNQGVVTINLVDAALSSDKDMDKFFKIMDERLELCHRALQIRHKRLSKVTSDVAPILWQYGAHARLKKGESIAPLLRGGYSTISLGYAGLYECVKYMTGHSHSDSGVGKEFGLKVMQLLNDKCKEWKLAEDIDYSVYGTPIESTSYKFAKCLKDRFGVIKGITDRDYITNSYHVPVFEEIDAYEKLTIESEFQRLSPGGAISYIETSNLCNNLDAVMNVVQFIYNNIMYAELNTKSDYCQVCGYDGEIKIVENLEWYCPNCGNRDHKTLNVARRTCGYIGTNFWNKGRTQEIKERVVHLDNKDSDL
jgi:ribonucleoside-triphosphate reductase